jgi:hypothetical protein
VVALSAAGDAASREGSGASAACSSTVKVLPVPGPSLVAALPTLHEQLEDRLELVARDPDAVVADANLDAITQA